MPCGPVIIGDRDEVRGFLSPFEDMKRIVEKAETDFWKKPTGGRTRVARPKIVKG